MEFTIGQVLFYDYLARELLEPFPFFTFVKIWNDRSDAILAGEDKIVEAINSLLYINEDYEFVNSSIKIEDKPREDVSNSVWSDV